MRELIMSVGIIDILDILIVAFFLYRGFMLIKGTRAEQLLKGVLILLIVSQISRYLHLYTIYWILDKLMNYGVFAILIVFQDELRKGLERIGRTKFFSANRSSKVQDSVVFQITEALEELSDNKIGALLIFERNTGLNEIAKTGTKMDSEISAGLLVNIFTPNTPLHDGATIILNDRIKAAGCFLPLSDDYSIKKTLGTRHRAAIGISEKSDALVVVVSEETGTISVAENGKLKRPVELEDIKSMLTAHYSSKDKKSSFFGKWRDRNGKAQ